MVKSKVKYFTFSCVDLRICIQISNTLNVNHNQLMPGTLKRKVTESLRSLSAEVIVYKTTVRVILDVAAVNEMLNMEEWIVFALNKLVHSHHKNVNFFGWIVTIELLSP